MADGLEDKLSAPEALALEAFLDAHAQAVENGIEVRRATIIMLRACVALLVQHFKRNAAGEVAKAIVWLSERASRRDDESAADA